MSRRLIATLVLLSASAQAQPFVREASPFPVLGPEGAVAQPFVGGLFEPRPQLVDLDGDGDADLVLNVGGAGLQYFERADGRFVWRTDRLAEIEPNAWSAFADLDGDGDLDLLTRGEPGRVRQWRNEGTASAPRFVLAASELTTPTGEPVRVEDSSIPDLADVDGDGDPDLLAGKADIGTITYYRNDGVGADGRVRFAFVTDQFEEIQVYEPNPSCAEFGRTTGWRPGGPADPLGRPTARHGANALTYVDVTGDGLRDLLWGDFYSPSLFFFENRGTATAPDLALVTNRYPIGTPLTSGGYNAPTFGDVDGDGDLDLAVGVQRGLCFNVAGSVENLSFFEAVDGGYRLQSSRLIETIDIGTRSTGALADLDGDGDLDLVLANETEPSGLGRASLRLYTNGGSAQAPSFRLADPDFLALDYDFGGYAPLFADLDADGDLDALVGGFNGRFAFLRNTGTRQRGVWVLEAERFGGVDAGQYARGTLGDVDGDGDLDLLAGASNGRVRLYRNGGTAQDPTFTTETNGQPGAADLAFADAIGLPDDIGEDAAPALADLDGDGDLDLMIGTARGPILRYTNTGTPSAPRFVRADSVVAGRRRPTPFLGDLTGRGRPDLLSGTDAGGVLYWHNEAASGTGAAPAPAPGGNLGLRVVPNPSTGAVTLQAGRSVRGEVVLFDARGREVGRLAIDGSVAEWDGRSGNGLAPAGLYLAQLRAEDRVVTVPFTRVR